MASSSLTVRCNRGVIRVFGGNRSNVRSMKHYYENIMYSDFQKKHPSYGLEDYLSLELSTRFNKR
jgi:hypothetical protein